VNCCTCVQTHELHQAPSQRGHHAGLLNHVTVAVTVSWCTYAHATYAVRHASRLLTQPSPSAAASPAFMQTQPASPSTGPRRSNRSAPPTFSTRVVSRTSLLLMRLTRSKLCDVTRLVSASRAG
jgi:hypothetical protein